jgi:hypothetical protein
VLRCPEPLRRAGGARTRQPGARATPRTRASVGGGGHRRAHPSRRLGLVGAGRGGSTARSVPRADPRPALPGSTSTVTPVPGSVAGASHAVRSSPSSVCSPTADPPSSTRCGVTGGRPAGRYMAAGRPVQAARPSRGELVTTTSCAGAVGAGQSARVSRRGSVGAGQSTGVPRRGLRRRLWPAQRRGDECAQRLVGAENRGTACDQRVRGRPTDPRGDRHGRSGKAPG